MRAVRSSRKVWAAIFLSLVLASSCRPKLAADTIVEPVVIRFAYRANTVKLQPLFDEFHQRYPWITVESVEAQRFGQQMDAVIRTATVDIFREGRNALAYAEEGLLRSLDPLELGDWATFQDDYYKGTWEGLSVQGRQWGIPAGLDTLVAYVNLERAEALNVAVPEPDWSLFDFLDLAIKMNHPEGLPHDPSIKLFGYCTIPESVMDPVVFIYLHGGRIVDDVNSPTQATLDDPLTVEAIQWYSDLFNRHDVAPDPEVIKRTFRQGGIYEAALRGACGMWLGWYSGRGGLDTRYNWDFEWQMLPLPQDRAQLGLGDVEGYYITANCAHPKEAIMLLRFLSGRWEAAGRKLPPRRSLINQDPYEDAVGKDVAAIARAFSENVIIMPGEIGPGLEAVSTELIKAIVEIVTEDLDADDVMAEAQQRVDAVFEGR